MATTPERLPSYIGLGWELIRTGTFTSNFDITGLNGNADKLWMLIMRMKHTELIAPALRFNNDSGSNYENIWHYSSYDDGIMYHEADQDGPVTYIYLYVSGGPNIFVIAYISAVAGQVRQVIAFSNEYWSTTKRCWGENIGVWKNTTDNITTINLLPDPVTAGEYWLFRVKT